MNQTNCQHLHTTSHTSGGVHLSAGTVWDDQITVTICRDCGRELEPGAGLSPAKLAELRVILKDILANMHFKLARFGPQSEQHHAHCLMIFRLEGILDALNRNAHFWRGELILASRVARQLGIGIPLLDDLAERYTPNE